MRVLKVNGERLARDWCRELRTSLRLEESPLLFVKHIGAVIMLCHAKGHSSVFGPAALRIGFSPSSNAHALEITKIDQVFADYPKLDSPPSDSPGEIL